MSFQNRWLGCFVCCALVALASCKPQKEAYSPVAVDKSPELPLDPAVLNGSSENGVRYLVRRHQTPDERVHVALVVRAGSMVEQESERGLSHFLQHLPFSGTGRFPGKVVQEFLAEMELPPTPDENATTHYTSTVYRFSAPESDHKLIARAFNLIEDIAAGMQFDPEVVRGLREPLLAELNAYQDSRGNLARRRLDWIQRGSPMDNREPMGLARVLETANAAQLRSLYQRTYRTNQMAVVAVGNFEPEVIARAIALRMGRLPKSELPGDTPSYSAELVEGEIRDRVWEPQLRGGMAELLVKQPKTKFTTEYDYQRRLTGHLAAAALKQRLDFQAEQAGIGPATVSWTPGALDVVDLLHVAIQTSGEDPQPALDVLTLELHRVATHGFLPEELRAARGRLTEALQAQVDNQHEADGSALVTELSQHFLTGDALPGPTVERRIGTRLLEKITDEEVNEWMNGALSSGERRLAVASPKQETLPEDQEMLARVQKLRAVDPGGYALPLELGGQLGPEPQPGQIVAEQEDTEWGTVMWQLGNGARVVFKQSSAQPGKVVGRAVSLGGTSRIGDRHFTTVRFAEQVVSAGGVGQHSAHQLTKAYEHRNLVVSPFIAEHEEGVALSAAEGDLAEALHLMHLSMTSPRRDLPSFARLRRALQADLANRAQTPALRFTDAIDEALWQGHLRRTAPAVEDAAALHLDVALKFYEQRMGNASDFVFVFVGDTKRETLKPLVARYLASLPGKPRKDGFRDRGARFPDGSTQVRVQAGPGPLATAVLSYYGEEEWSPIAASQVRILRDVLEARLGLVLETELEGAQGLSVWTSFERRPVGQYQVSLSFSADPSRVETLLGTLSKVVASLPEQAPSTEELSWLEERRAQRVEAALASDGFWLSALSEAALHEEPVAVQVEVLKGPGELSAPDVQAALRRYLRPKQSLKALLLPEPEAEEKAEPAEVSKPAAMR